MLIGHKIHTGMANTADPDQTASLGAVWSGSALFTCAIWSETFMCEILGHLLYTKGTGKLSLSICTVLSEPAHISLDKALFFSTKKYLYFSYFSMKTYVVGTH